MKTLYRARFLGQGFVIPFKTIIDVIAERKDKGTVLTAKWGELLYVLSENMIERVNKIKEDLK